MYTEAPDLGETPAMQFVLNDRLSDTATATIAAVDGGTYTDFQTGAEVRFESVLYRTERGNFFRHVHSTTKHGRGKPVVEDDATAMTVEDAMKWIAESRAMILDATGLQLPEQA
jgi:hypothetical protein